MNVLGKWVDERFLDHRRRSTSAAGVTGGVLAVALFGYRYYFDHMWSWDLLAVGVTVVVVKLALMVWYSLRD
jgi:hypothetical protein